MEETHKSFIYKGIVFTLILLMVLSIESTLTFAQQHNSNEILYAGTWGRESKMIHVFQFDRSQGKLSELQTVTEGSGPSFLAVNPNKKFLYAVFSKGTINKDENGSVVSFKIARSTGTLTKLNERSSEGIEPAHISIDPKGRFVYVSNYGNGVLTVYQIKKDGSLGQATDVVQHEGSGINPDRQKGPHVHSAIPSKDGKFIYVSDLGIDKIMIYKVEKTGRLSPAKTPFVKATPGSGPRHFVFHPSGNYAFSIEELSSSVVAFRVNKISGALTPLERIRTLPEGFTDKSFAADIHVSPDGKFLYASNRGHQSLAIYAINFETGKLTFVGYENTHISNPRNFCMDRNGEYVFVGNWDTGNIAVFKRNPISGKLTYTGEEAKIPAVACIVMW